MMSTRRRRRASEDTRDERSRVGRTGALGEALDLLIYSSGALNLGVGEWRQPLDTCTAMSGRISRLCDALAFPQGLPM